MVYFAYEKPKIKGNFAQFELRVRIIIRYIWVNIIQKL
jgi:hypothetical protein